MNTVHEVLTSMIEHWQDGGEIDDVDNFLEKYERRIHEAYHSLWIGGRQKTFTSEEWLRPPGPAVDDATRKWLDEAFTNPVTGQPYNVPDDIRRAAERVVMAYGIRGLSDPMYIANVIAVELGRGDGHGGFWQSDTTVVDRLVDFVRTPEWSVSMLEDIAAIIRRVRPDIGDDYDDDDPRCWQRH